MNDLFRITRWTLVGCVAMTLMAGPAVRAQQQTPGADQSDAQRQAQKARDEAQKEAQEARDEAEKERQQALREAQRDRERAQKEAQKARDEAQRERERALREAQREREQAQKEAQREREQAQRQRDEAARMRADAQRQRDDMMRLVGATVKLVKDKPFTAEAVTESVQMLPDGNRIVRRNQTNYFRDSSGRTRREQTLNSLGPQSKGGPMQTILIYDPVAKVDYVVDPEAKHARRIVITKMEGESGGIKTEIHINSLPRLDESRDMKEEVLPNKMIEGLNCTGKRTTITIPAGQIGNEKPLAIVQETWYSPDIEAVVQSTTSDPRSGTTSYKLTNVKRVEPPAEKFELPSDYSVSGPGAKNEIRIETRTETKTETKKDSKPN